MAGSFSGSLSVLEIPDRVGYLLRAVGKDACWKAAPSGLNHPAKKRWKLALPAMSSNGRLFPHRRIPEVILSRRRGVVAGRLGGLGDS